MGKMMHQKISLQQVQVLLAISLTLLTIVACVPVQQSFVSPIQTPLPSLNPEGSARHFVSTREQIPPEELFFAAVEPKTYPLTERDFVIVTFFHSKPDRYQRYEVLVDPATLVAEPYIESVYQAEVAAHQENLLKTPTRSFEPFPSRFLIDNEWATPTPRSSPTPQPQATGIPFDTLSLREDGTNIKSSSYNMPSTPTIFLVQSITDLSQVERHLQPKVLEQIQHVDFEQHIVLILLQGWSPSSGYRTEVERIMQHNGELVIHAQFLSPSPQWGVSDVETLPHHVVKIPRQSLKPLPLKLSVKDQWVTPTPLSSPSPRPAATEISFETLSLKEDGGSYEAVADPTVFLIQSSADLVQVEPYLSSGELAKLQNLEFDQHVALVLFRGLRGSTGHQTEIDRIAQRNGELKVYAQFWSPRSLAGAAETSPHHIIKIPRQPLEPFPVRSSVHTHLITPTPPVHISLHTEAKDIPFETLSLREDGGDRSEAPEHPSIFWIQSTTDLEQVESYLEAEVLEQLRNLEFDRHVALVLFRGSSPSTGYRIEIDRITQQNGELMVNTQFWRPSPDWEVSDTETSPHHIVKIPRQSFEPFLVRISFPAHMVTPTPPSN